MKPFIRPIAICPFCHAGKILVFEGWDQTEQRAFFRPLGGGIEFGESGLQALAREIKEEIDAEITNVAYLFTIENIF